jgi:hypothetical protein
MPFLNYESVTDTLLVTNCEHEYSLDVSLTIDKIIGASKARQK